MPIENEYSTNGEDIYRKGSDGVLAWYPCTEHEKVRRRMQKNGGFRFLDIQNPPIPPATVADPRFQPWQTVLGILSITSTTPGLIEVDMGGGNLSYVTFIIDVTAARTLAAINDTPRTTRETATGVVTSRGDEPNSLVTRRLWFTKQYYAFDQNFDPVARDLNPWMLLQITAGASLQQIHNMAFRWVGQDVAWDADQDEFSYEKHSHVSTRGPRTFITAPNGQEWLGLGHGSALLRRFELKSIDATWAEMSVTFFSGFGAGNVTTILAPALITTLPVAAPYGAGPAWTRDVTLTGGRLFSRWQTAYDNPIPNVEGFATKTDLEAQGTLLTTQITAQSDKIDANYSAIHTQDSEIVRWLLRLSEYKGTDVYENESLVPATAADVVLIKKDFGTYFAVKAASGIYMEFQALPVAERGTARIKIIDYVDKIPIAERGGLSAAEIKSVSDKITAAQKEIDDLEAKVAEDEKKLAALQAGKGLSSDIKAGTGSTNLDWSPDELAKGIDARAREVSEIRTITPPTSFAVYGSGVEVP